MAVESQQSYLRTAFADASQAVVLRISEEAQVTTT